MTRGRGRICIHGTEFDVHTVEFAEGRMTLVATRWDIVGKFTLAEGDDYSIIGYDGTLIGRGKLHMPNGPTTAEGTAEKPTHMTVNLPIGFEDKELS